MGRSLSRVEATALPRTFPPTGAGASCGKAGGSASADDATMTTTIRPATAGSVSPALRAEFRAGAGAIAPFLVGLLPFALVIGTTVAASGPFVPRLASTVLIMGGSAQLAVLQGLDRDAALWAVIATGVVINARLFAYSASLAAAWADSSRRFRALAAASILDATSAIVRDRHAGGARGPALRAYYAGAALSLCIGWTLLVIVGALTGTVISGGAVTLAAPLSLAVLLLPRLAQPGGAALIAVSGGAALLAGPLPPGFEIVAAVAAGLIVSWARAARRPREESSS